MTPEARIAAAIELIDDILQSASSAAAPADVVVRRFFKGRRYAGSGDRRDITGRVYTALRNWQELAWRLGKVGAEVSPRNTIIAQLVGQGEEPSVFFTGEGHAAGKLDESGLALIDALIKLNDPVPEYAKVNCPAWLESAARDRFGNAFPEEMTALNGRAPLDLRVNLLKSDRKSVLDQLEHEGIEAEPTSISPLGIRIENHINLTNHPLLRNGDVEVQDESAQIAALLAGATDKMQVVDLCAGAGGKALAIAAAMGNTGQIYAFDVSRPKLGELEKRARRAGARNIQIDRLPQLGDKRARRLRRLEGSADLVILDVPCSGSGTWRRNPDLGLRLTPDMLNDLIDQQEALLREGAPMVRPGGRLVYMTCSFLGDENEGPVSRFLDDHEGWSVEDFATNWPGDCGPAPATGCAKIPGALQLSPHCHGTDAFFVTVLSRRQA